MYSGNPGRTLLCRGSNPCQGAESKYLERCSGGDRACRCIHSGKLECGIDDQYTGIPLLLSDLCEG